MYNNKLRKLIKRKRVKRERERVGSKWLTWLLMCLNRSVATICYVSAFRYIYIYIDVRNSVG